MRTIAVLIALASGIHSFGQIKDISKKLENNRWKPYRSYFSFVNSDSASIYIFTVQRSNENEVTGELEKFWTKDIVTKHPWKFEVRDQLPRLTIIHEQDKIRTYAYDAESKKRSNEVLLHFSAIKNNEELELKKVTNAKQAKPK